MIISAMVEVQSGTATYRNMPRTIAVTINWDTQGSMVDQLCDAACDRVLTGNKPIMWARGRVVEIL